MYAILSIVIVSYVWTRLVFGGLTIRRHLRTKWATVGDTIEEEFEICSQSRLPILILEIEDYSELPGYRGSAAISLGRHTTHRWRTHGKAGKRGTYRLGPADVRVTDPFGLFTSERRLVHETSIVIYPPITIMRDVTVPAGSLVGADRSSLRTQQVTTDAGGLREFRPGDPLKRIHWLSSARHRTLLTKEFDLEPTASLWIALDLHMDVQTGDGDESTEEYGVKVVSSLAYQLVRDDKSVGFLAQGHDARYLIEPQRGIRQLWRILESLATIQARGTKPFSEVLTNAAPVLGRGVSVVAISPSANPSWIESLAHLAQQSVYPVALGIDSATFHGAPSNASLEVKAAAAAIPYSTVKQGASFTTVQPSQHGGPEINHQRHRALSLARR
jgi:uncharacterized protein (DUF58 family)